MRRDTDAIYGLHCRAYAHGKIEVMEAAYGCWLAHTGTSPNDWGFAEWKDEAERMPVWYDGDSRVAYGIRMYWAGFQAAQAAVTAIYAMLAKHGPNIKVSHGGSAPLALPPG